ncbi:MAG: hypothetical protein WD360_03700 [Nitriliruptoraceae bacterium]
MNDATDLPVSSPNAKPDRRPLAIVAIAVGFVMQLVVGVPFTVASGLLAPLWAVVVFYVLWIACATVAVRLAHRRPLATPLAPLVNAALLWLSLTAGDVFLGWTA